MFHGLLCTNESQLMLILKARDSVSESLTLSGIPLHAVLCRDLPKAVLGDSEQGLVVQVVVVNFSAKVEFALGLKFCV